MTTPNGDRMRQPDAPLRPGRQAKGSLSPAGSPVPAVLIDTDALDEAVRRFPKLLRCNFVPDRYVWYVRAEYRLVLKERENRRGQ